MGGKPRGRRARRGQGAARGPIPAEARYVNTTTLDDELLVRLCRLTQSKVVTVLYLVFGCAMIVAALLYVAVAHGNAISGAIITALGAFPLVQLWRLPRTTARRMSKELGGADSPDRTTTYYFTATEVGTVDRHGGRRSLPYAIIERVQQDDRMIALVMRDHSGVIVLDRNGFTKGSARDFSEALGKRLAASERHLRAPRRTKGHKAGNC